MSPVAARGPIFAGPAPILSAGAPPHHRCAAHPRRISARPRSDRGARGPRIPGFWRTGGCFAFVLSGCPDFSPVSQIRESTWIGTWIAGCSLPRGCPPIRAGGGLVRGPAPGCSNGPGREGWRGRARTGSQLPRGRRFHAPDERRRPRDFVGGEAVTGFLPGASGWGPAAANRRG
jgi:hypothetical protein